MALTSTPVTGGAQTAAPADPWAGKTGMGIHHVERRPDGSGYVQWGNGAVATFRPGEEGRVVASILSTLVGSGELTLEQGDAFARAQNYNFGRNEDGSYTISSTRSDSTGGTAGGAPTPPAAPAGNPLGSGGSSYSGGGGASLGGGGATSGGRQVGGGGLSPFSYGAPTVAPVPSISGFGGGATGGGGSLSWNSPLGFSNPGPGPGAIPGQGGTGGGFSYARPRSIFDGLPQNPTFGDVVGSVTRRQEENRNAALDVLGNARGEIGNDPNRGLMRQRTSDLLSNPYSLDEATIQQIMGKAGEGVTQRAMELRTQAGDRAAASGVGRSGSANAAIEGINNSAARSLAEIERDTRVQAALQNKQDLRSALGAALPGISEETGAKTNLDLAAARDVLGASSFYGDAFLSNLLNGKQGGYNIAVPNQGYQLGSNPNTMRF